MDADFVFVIIIVGIGCATAITIVFMALMFGEIKRRKGKRSLTDEEGEILQQLWDGIQKMEDRITNLETILLNRSKARDFERKL